VGEVDGGWWLVVEFVGLLLKWTGGVSEIRKLRLWVRVR
jgi:hypothetical protein